MSLIRGVLLAGHFRKFDELRGMSRDDCRNTLIVVMTDLSNQSNYQAFDDDTLAGMGAVMAFLRESRIRDEAGLRTMSADDQRNTLIVELAAQTGAGVPTLQGLGNLDLVLVGLGSARVTGSNPGVVSSFIRGVLIAGRFRTQRELNQMSLDDQRNTLIVELTAHSNQSNYQAFNNAELEGMGAVMVYLRGAGIRSDADLRRMSADDQRNTLISALGVQTHLGGELQRLPNLDLVVLGLGDSDALVGESDAMHGVIGITHSRFAGVLGISHGGGIGVEARARASHSREPRRAVSQQPPRGEVHCRVSCSQQEAAVQCHGRARRRRVATPCRCRRSAESAQHNGIPVTWSRAPIDGAWRACSELPLSPRCCVRWPRAIVTRRPVCRGATLVTLRCRSPVIRSLRPERRGRSSARWMVCPSISRASC